jgi:ROS/MUCR transcriptional regulator protein
MTWHHRPGDPPSPGPSGRLIRDEEADLVICALCGRGFRSLGSHLRVHELTADQYRRQFGLLRSRALSARELTATRSTRQRQAYTGSARMRADFAQGQTMARTGALSRQAQAAFAEHGVSAELARERLERLAAGRRTQRAASEEHTSATLERLGFRSLEEALRTLYVDRELSIEDTAALLEMSPRRTRSLLRRYAVPVRATGHNTTTGKRARVALNDRRTAERLGTADVTAWLRARRSEGATLRDLAVLTGRSVPWITARLRRGSEAD